MTAAGHQVSEPAVKHARPHRQIDHSLFLSVVNSCKQRLVRLLLHDLDLLDKLCRDVLRGKLRVVKEERLSIDHDLGYRLSIGCYGTVRSHFHAGKLLQKFLQHIIIGGLE